MFVDPRRQLDAGLDWHAQRVKWNAEGLCSRRTCHAGHDGRKHPQSGLLYCDPCADLIEQANPEMERMLAPLLPLTPGPQGGAS